MLSFLIGSVMIVVGMGLFTLGSDLSMTQIGNHIGARMTRSRKLGVILGLSFLLGVIITVAEPDLQVLANNVPEIDTRVLIITVSAGVGLFLMISMLRILFRIPLKWLLVVFYAGVFTLAALSEPSFLSVAFDSGGVTTEYFTDVNGGSVYVRIDNVEEHKDAVETMMKSLEFADDIAKAKTEAMDVKLEDIEIKR